MSPRLSTLVRRSVAALALIVATPAFGPRVSTWQLDVEAFVDWTATRGEDEVAVDRLFEPSAAGIEIASLGTDGSRREARIAPGSSWRNRRLGDRDRTLATPLVA